MYIKLFEIRKLEMPPIENSIPKYKDFIAKGGSHKVYYIDDDWVLKIPIKPFYSIYGKSELMISQFNAHINFMKENPEIFVNVKKLDKYRASVEKVDVEKAKEEIKHVYEIFKKIVRKYELWDDIKSTDKYVIHEIYNSPYQNIIEQIMEGFKEYYIENNDNIIKKWYDFINKLFNKLDNIYLDLHSGNFGIDKSGNIKLIDF